ncbi:hypothetical protein OUZ56_027950 [Daphnia magna]|uniref:Uncharacterized protein n=1 Tax=Daphnia magna TaxID=35525 RepID=A0ABR0B2E8_9CRUS|nr:hypothetical protein OUZ56_027950 [Daphnia magna]
MTETRIDDVMPRSSYKPSFLSPAKDVVIIIPPIGSGKAKALSASFFVLFLPEDCASVNVVDGGKAEKFGQKYLYYHNEGVEGSMTRYEAFSNKNQK